MYKLVNVHVEDLEYIVLESADSNSKARLCLNQGGRLDKLELNGYSILANMHPSTYKDNYASAILFPFANRIKNGEYEFNNLNYKLDCNEKGKDNALHGLVYNKMFECVDHSLNEGFGSVTLSYKDEGKSSGFPFKYRMELTYKLSINRICLAIKIINKDENPFPFTLGWHPYFGTKDLNNSSLYFISNTVFRVDNQQIPIYKTAFNETMPFNLKGKTLDTGYQLEDNQVELFTPEYQLKIESTSNENYLQLFVPSLSNTIAIEPMTGAADSFNNKTGLLTLNPNATYKVAWTISIEDSSITNN
ncbi:aldose 1-epimerase [Gillisia sp. CAL575]|uniref:aldose 1-epimerase n=1 Tax=Gillisia sp. CAL575 TaxID=985255 RepID=UPI0005514AD3|nr:aldose 1-epimerase [Gillisia sp. CAL575]